MYVLSRVSVLELSFGTFHCEVFILLGTGSSGGLTHAGKDPLRWFLLFSHCSVNLILGMSFLMFTVHGKWS